VCTGSDPTTTTNGHPSELQRTKVPRARVYIIMRASTCDEQGDVLMYVIIIIIVPEPENENVRPLSPLSAAAARTVFDVFTAAKRFATCTILLCTAPIRCPGLDDQQGNRALYISSPPLAIVCFLVAVKRVHAVVGICLSVVSDTFPRTP
jgi:hypothetical protein